MTIEEQARAHALKHFNSTYGERWREWPNDQQANAFCDYEQGFIDAFKLAQAEV